MCLLQACLVLALCLSSCRPAGPRFPQAGAPVVRVKLAEGSGPVPVTCSGPLGLTAGAVRMDLPYLRTADRLEREAGAWTCRGRRFASPMLVLSPAGDGHLAFKGRAYRGTLRLLAEEESRWLAVNVLDVDTYLAGVLNNELPYNWHAVTFEALAIAARTYVLYQKATIGAHRAYDVTATAASQMYQGRHTESSKAWEAVSRTGGIVLAYGPKGREKIFPTYYCSTCGGGTRPARDIFPSAPDVPPLRGARVDFCRGLSPYYRWGPLRLKKSEIAARLRTLGEDGRYPAFRTFGDLATIRATEKDPAGRILRVAVEDRAGRLVRLPAETLRHALGAMRLRSTWCRIVNGRDEIVFRDGRGFGHGVGLCQYGAEGLARRGRNCLEILRTFYPGSVPVRAY